MTGISEDVARIADWVTRHAGSGTPMFAAPATADDVTRAEAALGLAFPQELRALYRAVDGQSEAGPTLLDAFRLMSLAEIVDAAAFLNDFFPDGRNAEAPDHAPIDADRGIRATWWWPRWLPVMTNDSGDYHCVDLDPAEGGTAGQVIAYYHDETFRSLIAASIAGLVHGIASGLDSGRYTIDDDMIVALETR